jgi:hypothetical protein
MEPWRNIKTQKYSFFTLGNVTKIGYVYRAIIWFVGRSHKRFKKIKGYIKIHQVSKKFLVDVLVLDMAMYFNYIISLISSFYVCDLKNFCHDICGPFQLSWIVVHCKELMVKWSELVIKNWCPTIATTH